MSKAKRIFFVTDERDYSDKLFLSGLRKLTKGLIRLGHDTHVFNYRRTFLQAGPIMSRKFARRWCKKRMVDPLLNKQVKDYAPDIIHVDFANYLNAETIMLMREVAPNAFFIGSDGDPWPEYHKNRLEIGAKLDLLTTTFEGKWLDSHKNAGARCVFMPNMCDPDIDHRYEIAQKWKTDILFTGQAKFGNRRYPVEDTRYRIVSKLTEMEGCALYGCFGRPRIGGINYLYAISGARIGLSVNVVSNTRLYHSDRLIHYLACGTLVLAKRSPDSDLLFKDGVHLRYFDTVEEFFDLANYYLKHEDERIKIADAGMQRVHAEFNCERIAKYILDLVETGTYDAPWT